jgi:hypothetical protein
MVPESYWIQIQCFFGVAGQRMVYIEVTNCHG